MSTIESAQASVQPAQGIATPGEAQTTDQAGAEATKAGERISPQFAALARKEKAMRLAQQKFVEEKKQWEQEQNKYKTDYIPKDRLTKETLSVLGEMGITQDQLANMLLTHGQPQSQEQQLIAKLTARLDELEGKTTKVETDFKDQQSKSYEQAVNQIRNEAKILIDSDPEYETIKQTGNIEAVVEHIKQTFDQDGIILSVQDAAKEIEETLVEEAIKLASINKVKSKLQPPAPPEPQKPQAQQKQTHSQVKTLTHDMSSSSAPNNQSAKDRYKRAIMRAQGIDPDTGKPLG